MPVNLPDRIGYRDTGNRAFIDRATGLAIVAILPAVFWSIAVLYVTDKLSMADKPAITLAVTTGLAAALFLALICAPLMFQRRR